jgi:ribosomal protein S12 methylthiotransferase
MSSKPSIGMITLGCPKNLVDSEVMLGLLQQEKYVLATDVEHCDVALINTCSFIDASRKESLESIQDLARLKKEGKVKGVIVCGCYGQMQSQKIMEEIPEVDAVLGSADYPKLPQVVEEVLSGQKSWYVSQPRYVYDHETPRILLTPKHTAYVKISEGCNHPCSFCIIPRLRGKHRSRTMGSIIEEVRSLAALGVKEINLIGQDTSYYGFDLVGKSILAPLLNELNKIDGIRWIRVLYLYPRHTTDEILEAIAKNDKVCAYIDCPLQHINDRLLAHMQRRVTRQETEQLIHKVRTLMPQGVFRTTFIVGYPGETDQEFKELLDFVKETRFERMGAFTYSYENQTLSGKSPDQLPEEVKQQRRHQLMSSTYVNASRCISNHLHCRLSW